MDNGNRDSYYDILQISREATEKEIQQAYRRLAKILHPDVCREPDAEELFKELNCAYSVLSDPQKRSLYDATLRTGQDYESRVKEDAWARSGYDDRYRDPATWFYQDRSTYKKSTSHHHTSPEKEQEKRKIREFSIPHWGQVLLFFLTLVMAITIITQLIVPPILSQVRAGEADTVLLNGEQMAVEEEYLLAIQYYTRYLEIIPNDPEVWYRKGEAQVNKGDRLVSLFMPEEAPRYYREAVTSFIRAYEYSGDLAPLKRAGDLSVRVLDWNRAEEIFTEITGRYPNDTNARNTLYNIQARKAGLVRDDDRYRP